MPICHLQCVAEAEVRKRPMRIELSNNGGEFERVVVTMFFEQIDDERIDGLVVERMALCSGIEPSGLCFRSAVLPGCGGMSQESQES
jgi:hypothetical protein